MIPSGGCARFGDAISLALLVTESARYNKRFAPLRQRFEKTTLPIKSISRCQTFLFHTGLLILICSFLLYFMSIPQRNTGIPTNYFKHSTAACSIGSPAAYRLMNSSKPATSSAFGAMHTPVLPPNTRSSRNASRVSPSFLLSM